MLSAISTSFPFVLHILVETPAALTFALSPSATLSVPQPHAEAVIRQYALLLLSSNLVAAIFIFRDQSIDDCAWLESRVAAALGLYHLGPMTRAVARSWRNEVRGRGLLEQPWVHAWVHAVCFVALAGRGMHWW